MRDDRFEHFDPDDLDAERLSPYGVRVTTPDGEEYEFEVPDLFRSMNHNQLLELYRERMAMDGTDGVESGRWYSEGPPHESESPEIRTDGGRSAGEDSDTRSQGVLQYVAIEEIHPDYREQVCWNCENRRLLGPNQQGRVCHECFMGQQEVDHDGEYVTDEGYVDYGALWYGDVPRERMRERYNDNSEELWGEGLRKRPDVDKREVRV